VIVATSWQAIAAAQQSTTTVPIVMAAVADPVNLGFVESLASPGANITGMVVLPGALAGTQLDLLKEAVARTSRIAVLLNPANPDHAAWRDLIRRAESQGMRLRAVGVRGPADLEAAFPAMTQEGVDGLLVLEDPMFVAQRGRLAALAMKSGLPAVYGRREYVDAGGLLSYGPSTPALLHEAAGYVDRILKGARPRDLPVRQPAKLEMVVSRRTATALGLSIRASVLGRASHVIE
jgi:putative ABC transport system substrate-binding protein